MTPLDAKRPLQLNDQGQLRHFLSLDGLPRELLTEILDTADSFLEVGARAVKKVPLLRGKTICNVFFENSTRTRTTFELAAQRLSADVITLNVSTSSASKGETLLDTLRNLEAMAADMFVVRHGDSGAAHFIAEHVCPQVAIINGGDGRHAHPTQGMLDMLTIRRHKGSFENLSVAIVGDILHSRVARSNMLALKTLGCPDIRVIAPKTLLPIGIEQYGVKVYTDMTEGLKDVDVVIMLRLQRERMAGGLLPSEGEFYRLFGLTTARLAGAKPDAIVMHPGPINRGVEIESAVADGPHSVILNQVTYGIADAHGGAVHGHERANRAASIRAGERPVKLSILGARVIDPGQRPGSSHRSSPGSRQDHRPRRRASRFQRQPDHRRQRPGGRAWAGGPERRPARAGLQPQRQHRQRNPRRCGRRRDQPVLPAAHQAGARHLGRGRADPRPRPRSRQLPKCSRSAP